METPRPARWIVFGLAAWVLTLPSPVRGQEFRKHVVVCAEAHAADVGRDVLRAGGNAVDAAIATAFALAVTHPEAGNLGGGGFLVAFRARTRDVVTIDFREMAPAAATSRMYLDDQGRLLPHHRAGPRAAGVPGTVRGLGLAHELYGKTRWADLVQPAAELARNGFPVSDRLARSLNGQLFEPTADPDGEPDADRLADFPASVAAFRQPDGAKWQAGDRLVQPDLAATLSRIAEQGASEFYEGRTAALVADHSARHGGVITLKDLAAYRAVSRRPVHSTFRGFDVYGMGPPASGGIVLAEMLNILERFDLKADGPQSARTLHRVTEAMRRAYFVRATRLADPDFVQIDVDRLVSRRFADELAATITDRATPSARLADFPIVAVEPEHTTHLSTIDSDGNAAALTYTLEESFGAKDTVAGAGFLLNNEMGDFNLIPGLTDSSGRIGTPANLIAPGKRMLSSQTPTIVLKDGRVRLVTGSPGGRTIPNTVLWVVLNVLEFGLDPQAAVAAPRTHHAWFPDVLSLEESGWTSGALSTLRDLGYRLRFVRVQGDAHTIVVDSQTGRYIGAADPRRKHAKASGD